MNADAPITPTLMWKVDVHDLGGSQGRLCWGGHSLSILEITDQWYELGRWWQGEKPAELHLVYTPMGMFLLWRERDGKVWYAKPVH